MFATLLAALAAPPADGAFVRFRLSEPSAPYYVTVGGYIHNEPWYLPSVAVPAGADRDPAKRTPAGQFTPWLDLKAHAGKLLHRSAGRAGGVAELPNLSAAFVTGPGPADRPHTVAVELATAPDAAAVVKRWDETFAGDSTSVLVSPDLRADAGRLESAAEMTARRLGWAKAATGGERVSPKSLIIQTSFWAPQRPELNLREAEVLRLLGFNVVGNQTPEVRAKGWFQVTAATHDVPFGPAASREDVDKAVAALKRHAGDLSPGAPLNIGDEITSAVIGKSAGGLADFRAWLAAHKVDPKELGVTDLNAVMPVETPAALAERQKADARSANRAFYYTSRYRQHATTERFGWVTAAARKHLGPNPRVSTLLADHPYFSGTGLGMGTGPNPAWGSTPLAADWFGLARAGSLDLLGVEDWLGLQYMYGPGFTFEGFQLMGFQAAMLRSASRGKQAVIAWVTPSDETNLRLKSMSALAQGAKHFYYWTYGPTATSTENYWSDLRGAYDGVAKVARHLAAAEHAVAPGATRPAKVALLYSVSSDLWQPFGYAAMLERRALYLALVHEQFLVDFVTEEDVEAGRLADYRVLYAADPCVSTAAAGAITEWVRGGGALLGTTAAGSRNEFNEPVPGLAAAFGVEPVREVAVQPGVTHVRGALNGLEYTDEAAGGVRFGALGTRAALKPTTGRVAAAFRNGDPAAVANSFGRGKALLFAASPGLAYLKEAKFVPAALGERWTADARAVLTRFAREHAGPDAHAARLSHPVVEAGVYDAPAASALVLANFTYEPIEKLAVELRTPRPAKAVRSCERGPVRFTAAATGGGHGVRFEVPLSLTDIVVVEY